MEGDKKTIKNATLKMQLKADSGFSSKVECKVNAYQWQIINDIIESKSFSENNFKTISKELNA